MRVRLRTANNAGKHRAARNGVCSGLRDSANNNCAPDYGTARNCECHSDGSTAGNHNRCAFFGGNNNFNNRRFSRGAANDPSNPSNPSNNNTTACNHGRSDDPRRHNTAANNRADHKANDCCVDCPAAADPVLQDLDRL